MRKKSLFSPTDERPIAMDDVLEEVNGGPAKDPPSRDSSADAVEPNSESEPGEVSSQERVDPTPNAETEVKSENEEGETEDDNQVGTKNVPSIDSPVAGSLTDPPKPSEPLIVVDDASSVQSTQVPPSPFRPASSLSEQVPSINAAVSLSTPAPPTAAITTTSVIAPSHKRKRLPQDKVGILSDKITLEPHDSDSWLALINEYVKKGKISEVRATYESFFKIFPQAAKQWVAYASFELSNNEFLRVEQIFGHCLRSVLSIDLWRFYLDYIRRRNNITIDGLKARTIISQAYEFVLANVGIDIDSGPTWQEYLQFIKTAPASSSWEEAQKMDNTRRVFQKAVCLPVRNIEGLWKDYDAFENGISKLTARKFLGEKSPAYMTARGNLRELQNITANVVRNATPKPPSYSASERMQLQAWKKWIMWEKADPLLLEDQLGIQARVIYVLKQSVMAMPFYAETWYDAADYCLSVNREKEGLDFLRQGMEATPTSTLLFFRYVEHEELHSRTDDLKAMLETLLTNLDNELVNTKIRAEERMAAAKSATEKIEQNMTANISSLKREIALTWVVLMRTTRRIEGVKGARQVFAKARRAPNATYHIFIASAMMEYHCSNDPSISGKIFDLGMRQFGEEGPYILAYFDFLLTVNDLTNARVLFEKAVSKLSSMAARPLFERFYAYECAYGDLSSVMKLDRRFLEAYPSAASTTDQFLKRNSMLDAEPMPFLIPLPPQSRREPEPDIEQERQEQENGVGSPMSMGDGGSPGQGAKKRKVMEIPQSILKMLAVLPPASSWSGALFKVDELMKVIAESTKIPAP